MENGIRYMTSNEKFLLILNRYEIEHLWIAPSLKGSELVQGLLTVLPKTVSEVEDREDAKGKCLSITGTEEEQLQVAADMQMVLTAADLKNLLTAPDEKFVELPQIYHTIENSFGSIAVVRSGTYSEKIINYYRDNENIDLVIIEGKELSFQDKRIICARALQEDAILIMPDLWPDYEVYDGVGKKLVTLINKKIYKAHLKTTEYLYDVNERIIPGLVKHGIKVINIYVPDVKRITRAKQVARSMKFWQRLRHYCPKIFEELRLWKTQSKKLQPEINSLINDNSKGYSEVRGNGKYINFDNGFRRTIGNHAGATNNIFMFGPCFVRGINSEDALTIPSRLKRLVGDNYNVLNYGSTFHTINLIMRSIEYRSGDIVILFSTEQADQTVYARRDDVIYHDLTDTYEKIPDIEKHIFDLAEHFDGELDRQIAQDLYELLVCNKCLEKNEGTPSKVLEFGPVQKRIPSIIFNGDSAFGDWLHDIVKKYRRDGKNGAIVMNCNPFTKGHRYLIETAASQVDNLYIFVVQEDKSEFPFEDRYMLVQKGTSDLENVVVLPSGKYVISSSTLPGYFEKESLKTTLLDATHDLQMFMQIADSMRISVRFAGEEPLDPYTKQYNDNMARILPKHGIEFSVIRRKEEDSEVISASRVRKALKAGDFDLVKRLVPPTTYDYLYNRYSK